MVNTISVYSDIFRIKLEEFALSDGEEARKSLKFGKQKINLYYSSLHYQSHANCPTSGSLDIRFFN